MFMPPSGIIRNVKNHTVTADAGRRLSRRYYTTPAPGPEEGGRGPEKGGRGPEKGKTGF